MRTFKKLFGLLTTCERKRAGLLLGMILVMALLDTLGVASIMPFMAVLANPGVVESNETLKTVYSLSSYLGIDTTEKFLFFLGIIVFILLIGSLAFKALTTFARLRFTLMREFSVSKRLIEGYLNQPYSWFLSQHSADLGKNILSEVGVVIGSGLMPFINIIAQGAIVIALLTLLIVVDPMLSLIVGMSLTAAYGLMFKISSGLLERMGKERLEVNRERFTAANEAFSAIKEVKVGGMENIYTKRFARPAQTYAHRQALAQIIGQLPRFALEAVAFGGMLLVILYLMSQSGGFANALPVVALYALAGYRLMPALQQIYVALTQLRFVTPALDALHNDLANLHHSNSVKQSAHRPAKLLSHAITLDNIVYRYPNTSEPTLKHISLTIPAKSIVGLVGTTGSGKTTAVDLILGLLEAQEGSFAIDGKLITEHNKRAWQSVIGYVPQQIYLADNTVAANIAFGIEPEQIDITAVEFASKIANLHEFVTNDLPQGYFTTIGERGVRLSGGQRQRIGIARALYHKPEVLILDEATSALGTLTEQAVMDAVYNLEQEVTIILIAHRLSTVKNCDHIFMLEKGELRAQGTFDELTESNTRFRAMVSSNQEGFYNN